MAIAPRPQDGYPRRDRDRSRRGKTWFQPVSLDGGFFFAAAATLNIAAWCLTANTVARRQPAMPVDAFARCKIQLILSAVYVLGCAFRSVLPVYDIPRLGLFDTWLSSVLVGRSVATIAELSFAAQWAVMLDATAQSTGSGVARIVSRLIMPLIATAEICSWTAVLTTPISATSLKTHSGAFPALWVLWPSCRSFPAVPPSAGSPWLRGVLRVRSTWHSCSVSTCPRMHRVGRPTRRPANTT